MRINVKASMPIVQILDKLVNIKPGESMTNKILTQLKNNASDSLALLSCTNQSILQTRRDAIVQQLSKEYKQLRTDVPKDSTKLFGDDLKARLATIKASNKASIKTVDGLDSKPRNYHNKGYTNYQTNYQSKNYRGNSKRRTGPFEQKAPRYKGYYTKKN